MVRRPGAKVTRVKQADHDHGGRSCRTSSATFFEGLNGASDEVYPSAAMARPRKSRASSKCSPGTPIRIASSSETNMSFRSYMKNRLDAALRRVGYTVTPLDEMTAL